MKNHLYKAALLAALGLALSPVAKASDMYVGFNDFNYYGTSGDDYVIDLGSYSQFTTSASFSDTINSGLFSQAFGTDVNAGNDVAVGAVDSAETGTGYLLMATGASQPSVTGTPAWNFAYSAASAIPTGVNPAAGSSTSPTWDYLVAQSPSLYDQSGNGVASEIGNPESSLVNGDVTLTLWESTLATGLNKKSTAFAELGTLTIDANSSSSDPDADTITFTGVNAVPEPGTFGLFAIGGLLVHALRRRFFGKVA